MSPLALPVVAGVGCLMLAAYDIYATILQGRARAGPVSRLLTGGLWRVSHAVAFKLSRPRRHRLLNFVGPLMLPLLICALLLLVLVGYACLYYPHMPSGFAVAPDSEAPSWLQALYFSGTTVTTLGYGDLTPRSGGMRLLALMEATTGFALISLALTYLVAVYGALERKRAVALSFYHQAEEGADVAGLLVHHFVNDRFVALDTAAIDAARDLHSLLESHIEHPVLHYFHPLEVHKSLPRMLFLVLETSAVVRTCLAEKYLELRDHPDMRTFEASGTNLLRQMLSSVLPGRDAAAASQSFSHDVARQRGRFDDTVARLTKAGIRLRADRESSWRDYQRHRQEWEPGLHDFARFAGYDWDEVTGDRSLEDAADREQEEQKRPRE